MRLVRPLDLLHTLHTLHTLDAYDNGRHVRPVGVRSQETQDSSESQSSLVTRQSVALFSLPQSESNCLTHGDMSPQSP